MTLLSICQDAAVICNLATPVQIVGNSDPTAALLLALTNIEGQSLARRHDWQALVTPHTWTTTASEAQASALPAAYDRLVYNPQIWDRTGSTPLTGPSNSQTWSTLKNGGTYGGIYPYWRIIGGVLNVFPAPSAGRTFALEYVSKNWVTGSKAKFEADADTALLPEELIKLGLIWRWRHNQRFDYADDLATYEREFERYAARDRAVGVINTRNARAVEDMPSSTWMGTVIP